MWLTMDATSKNVIGFSTKVNVDLGAKTFNVTSGDDQSNTRKITVKNGKVVVDGAVGSETKTVTDAISFDVTVDSDPSVIYQVKGYGRTRFTEDDH
ncbi:lipid-binding protein [Pedobacter sp. NJ-S-72]